MLASAATAITSRMRQHSADAPNVGAVSTFWADVPMAPKVVSLTQLHFLHFQYVSVFFLTKFLTKTSDFYRHSNLTRTPLCRIAGSHSRHQWDVSCWCASAEDEPRRGEYSLECTNNTAPVSL